jgi:Tfp pilus assembly protein PilF
MVSSLYVLSWCVALAVFNSVSQGANQDIQNRVQQAEKDYDLNRYKDAEQELNYVLSGQPDQFAANELMGLVLSAEGRDAKATIMFERAVRANPTSIPARANLATNYAKLGQNSKAELQFTQLARMDPKNFAVLHNLGEFYVKHGQIAEAVPWLQKAQVQNPEDYANGYDLSLGLLETGRLAEAEQQIQGLLRIRETAELHSLLADAYERDGKVLAAGKEYQRAAQMSPNEANVFDWGAELLRHRNLPEAKQVFSRGMSLFPQSTRMVIGFGLAEHLAGEDADASRTLMHAVDLDLSDARSYYFLASLKHIPPELMKGVTARFAQYAARYPKRADAQYYYASNLWLSNEALNQPQNYAEIEDRLRAALALDPRRFEAHQLLGILYEDRGDYKRATAEFEAAIQEKPSFEEAHYRLALVLNRVGQRQRAEQEMKQFKTLQAADKEDVVITFLLSKEDPSRAGAQ